MHENDFFNEDLLCALAGVAGEDNVLMSEPMREHTTFKIGGPADVFVTPDTEQGLVATLDTCYRCDLPLTIVGNGSDLLVGDKGIRGVVVALGEGLSDITVDGTHVTAAAGALLSDVAAAAAEANAVPSLAATRITRSTETNASVESMHSVNGRQCPFRVVEWPCCGF